MSWEANIWAIKQRMKLPQEQLVLIVLGNCADPDAVAFSKWPGRDHWWKYLSKITRLSRSSLFRHINTIVALGLAERSMLVLADGSKRPTIALNLDASFDIETEEDRYLEATQGHSRAESHHETPDDDGADGDENASDGNALQAENAPEKTESHGETAATLSPTHGTDPVPPMGLHIDSSKSCSKDSPLPPSGGLRVPDDLFEQFVKAWGEPIPKLALTRSAWDHVETSIRPKAIAGARGYFAWLRAHPKPPSAISAQAFLRDSGGWEQWLRYLPDADGKAASITSTYPNGSPEAKALGVLYAIAGKSDFFRQVMQRATGVNYSKPVTPQLLALAKASPPDEWQTLSHRGAGSWEDFLRENLTVARRPLREGDRAPWPWPPSTEGKIYTPEATPPPPGELSDQDAADFV